MNILGFLKTESILTVVFTVVGVDHQTLQLTFTLLLTLSEGICCAENASHTQA